MLRTENVNKEILNILNAKIQRDYDKLLKKMPNKESNETKEKIIEGLTLGNDRNDKVIFGSLAVPTIPIAIGVGKSIIGMITLLPSITGAPNEESVAFFEKAREFSENTLQSGVNDISKGAALFALPAGIAAISLSMRIYKNIKKNREDKLVRNGEMIKLIDDILAQKEDPTLEFAYKFLKRVDLSENDGKLNLGILDYMTYYRYVQQLYSLGKASQEDVEKAYDNMIIYFKIIKNNPKCSQKFKNNRFLNILISEYDEKMEEEELLGAPVR